LGDGQVGELEGFGSACGLDPDGFHVRVKNEP